jgi:hypothetical protein
VGILSLFENRWNKQEPISGASRNAGYEGEERMVVQTTRRSVMAGMAATAAALLPVDAIEAAAGGASEGLAYRTAGDLVKAIAGQQVSSRELVDSAISRIEALDPKINAVPIRARSSGDKSKL